MSASVVSDAIPMATPAAVAPETQSAQAQGVAATVAAAAAAAEVESVKCDCCGLTEECTPAYIGRVRERYAGRWVCGLCAEAVKDEICRSSPPLIGTEEALGRHAAFCRSFRSSPAPAPADANEHLISAMRQLLRRSLDSPRPARSTPAAPGGSFPARWAPPGAPCRGLAAASPPLLVEESDPNTRKPKEEEQQKTEEKETWRGMPRSVGGGRNPNKALHCLGWNRKQASKHHKWVSKNRHLSRFRSARNSPIRTSKVADD